MSGGLMVLVFDTDRFLIACGHERMWTKEEQFDDRLERKNPRVCWPCIDRDAEIKEMT